MKTVLLAIIISSLPSIGAAIGDRAVRDWNVSTVSVSTTTPTAIPTTAFSGRYKAIVQNLDPNFDLFIGTSAVMTTALGFVVPKSSGTIELPIPAGVVIYGLGEANATRGTLSTRIIEYK